MKVQILLALLLCISFVFAQDSESAVDDRRPYPCGYGHCQYGHVCFNSGDDCNCIPEPDCRVTLKIKFIGRWEDGSRGGKTFSQYDVIVTNNSNRTIRNVYIGTGYNFHLRDSNSIWNANVHPYGVLSLTQSITSGASFTFGFIIYGSQTPNLRVLAVTY